MRFIIGVLLGVTLGASFGLLLAPQPGSETRKALRDRIRRRNEASEEEI